MSYLSVDIYVHTDAFDRRVADRFIIIEALNLGSIREKLDTLRVELLSNIESYMSLTPPVIP